MTKDVIALTYKMPDAPALLAGLHAGGPDLDVDTAHDGAVIQLRAAGSRPLVSVEAPLFVQVPGEAQRLLGPDAPVPDVPFWWTEARATTAVPETDRLAGSLCGRLSTLLGGTVWPPDAEVSLAVVEPSDDEDITAHPEPAGALPAVDVLTDSTAVVITDRPVIPLTAWLSHILRATTASGRALHIVTPPHARLSLPLRAALTGAPNRWVVQHPDHGYYDGLSGAVLRWQDGTFTPARTEDGQTAVADAFTTTTSSSAAGHQLLVSFRAHHEPHADLILGRGLEAIWQHLTDALPTGWGTAEPINLPWSTRQLTDLARDRAPEPSHLLAVGAPDRPALASLRITRTKTGVAEDITLAVGYTADETPPLDTIEALAQTLVAEHDLVTMLVTLRQANRDLTIPPRFEAPPNPVSYTLGSTGVRDTTLTQARRPPLSLRPVQLGPTTDPALHYPLGDGTDAAAWTTLQQLTVHLEAAAGVAG
ncbi:DUF6177 family protein [Streptomyces alboflavus]|uniref:DUF6177 family protein n=1 Tax=Streptomyces alboflavus TaxID=67267 RepID=UPI000F658E82|nr:DUF6177 family protein [Streptomyces alboflavus]